MSIFKIKLCLFCVFPFLLFSQKNPEKLIADSLTQIAAKYANVGKISVSSLQVNEDENTLTVYASEGLSNIPLRPENVERIYAMISNVTKKIYPDFKISCISDKQKIENLIPNYFAITLDKTKLFDKNFKGKPFITNLSRPYQPANGLHNKIIALWQSHGLYYNQGAKKWLWQRAKLFQTVEDLYTQSFVLPYLVPMLENAGANLFLPRERDTQRAEIIIDNDNTQSDSRYHEDTDIKDWKTEESGFANPRKEYLQGENPFKMGTSRMVQCIDNLDELSYAEWIPSVPDKGKYAVYVSFKTVKKSAPDARYTVFHKGGKTEFKVNQTMGGGTWIYLGTFMFDKGRNNHYKVVLSNYSSFGDKVVSADAVKIGGGMGNIARAPNLQGILPNQKSSDTTKLAEQTVLVESVEPLISNYPRYTEGARYWLQWAGMPDSIYSRSKGKNDYTDDYQSRGFWVNYLAGGSSVLPNREGLNLPVDLAFAFHSDAGTFLTDSIVGTLGICTVNNSDGKTTFENGASRWASRDLADLIQTQITDDVRKSFAPEWVRRGLWNKNYSESRTPEVPVMLLELLSHQNFADMRYGLDPRFRFVVSRAVYKGILRFLYADTKDYVVQPLPIENFRTKFIAKNTLQLNWKAAEDSIEPTAKPDKYILYTRIDDGDFNNGQLINDTKAIVEIASGKIYSFKVAALNRGGESFPSEILSACRVIGSHPDVLIVNGFDRVSAPGSFAINHTSGGFVFDKDAGVPYLNDYSFIGKQFDFDRTKLWKSDENPGFGHSFTNFEDKVIAGNTFDYTYLHGKSIKAAGYSFVSCAAKTVTDNEVDLSKYAIVDLILGKQKKTFIGNSKKAPVFKTFPLALQKSLRQYCDAGGNLMLSGAFIGSDMYVDNYIPVPEKLFLESTLKYRFKADEASFSSQITMVASPFHQFSRAEFKYYNEPNSTSIFAESVDAIEPADMGAFTICRYKGTNLSAGVAYSGSYKCCSLGFPFEVIESEKERNKFMNSMLNFFAVKKSKTLKLGSW